MMSSMIRHVAPFFLFLQLVFATSELKFGLFTPKCYDLIFNKFVLFDIPCLKLLISKGLGYATICGAFILKVPQILKMVNSKSSESVAATMFYMECVSFTASAAYNIVLGYPLSTYGENLVILVQNYIVILLIWKYSSVRPSTIHMLAVPLIFVMMWVGFLVLFPIEYIAVLPMISTVSNIFGRIPQILENMKAGNTGQLSFITFFLNFAGSAARVFTTLQEVDDNVILGGYVIGAFLNFVLVVQFILYWNSGTSASQTLKKKQQ